MRLLCSLLLLWAFCVEVQCEEPLPLEINVDDIMDLPLGTKILDRTANEWVVRLQGTEREEERKIAMLCLAEFGRAAGDAVQELIAVSRDQLQPENERWATMALGAIGPAAKPAVPQLLALLADAGKPAAFRAEACGALARIDPKDPKVRRALLAALRDSQGEIRQAAIEACVPLAPHEPGVLPALCKALLVPEDAAPCATALLCLGAPGIDALIKALERAPEGSRAAAAEALGCIGPDARAALPMLMRSLKAARDPKSQATLLLAAARIAPKDPGVLEAAAERLAFMPEAEQKELRSIEARLLIGAGPLALRALQTSLRSKDVRARLMAVALLSKLPVSEALIGDLIARAQDRETPVQLAAIKALDSLGPAAVSAGEALTSLAQAEQDRAVRNALELAALNVARAPGTPRCKSALQAKTDAELIKLLRDPAPPVRQEAAEALRTRNDDSGVIANALIDTLDDLDEQVRIAAARGLVRFGSHAKVALKKLTEWLEADNPAMRKAALAALAGMGEDAKPALPVVVATATSPSADDDKELGKFLSITLRTIGPDAVPALTAELKNEDSKVRARAARALGSMEVVGATALPELLELSKSAVDSDAEAGFAALAAMGPIVYSLAGDYLVKTILGETFADRRRWATWAVCGIKVPEDGDPHRLIDALLQALMDEDEGVCRGAHAALVRIGKPALPKLRDMLKLGQGEAPYWAVRVLARMRADPEDVIPKLVELTEPGKRDVERGTAAELLGEYAPEHTQIAKPLLRVLAAREDFVARCAIMSLAKLGEPVVPPLKKLLQDRHPLLRRRALEALAAVRAKQEAR